jgi:hemerythrin
MCLGSQAVVWIEDAADTGSLVHELYHVVQDFLKHITSSDEETGAYLIQYLFREAIKKNKP